MAIENVLLLKRHKLSAMFSDMPSDEFLILQKSIDQEGLLHPVIKLYEGKILDGWHRYMACKMLNKLDMIIFEHWDTEKDGDPRSYVLAENLMRRHLTTSQRSQIVVEFNERLKHGDVESQRESSNDDSSSKPKTREQLATEAGVSKSSIDRAVQVQKAGESEAVISGEKTSSEVLSSDEQAKLRKATAQAAHNHWATKFELINAYNLALGGTPSFDDLLGEYRRVHPTRAVSMANAVKRTEAHYTYKDFLDKIFEKGTTVAVLETERQVMLHLIRDLKRWRTPEWDDTPNWIYPFHPHYEKMKAEREKAEAGDTLDQELPKKLQNPVPTEDTADKVDEKDVLFIRAKVKDILGNWKSRNAGKDISEGAIGHVSMSRCLEAAAALTGIEMERGGPFELYQKLQGFLESDDAEFIEKVKEVAGITARIDQFTFNKIKDSCNAAVSRADTFVAKIANEYNVSTDAVNFAFDVIAMEEDKKDPISMICVMWDDGSSIDFGDDEDCAAPLTEIHPMTLNSLNLSAILAYVNILNRRDVDEHDDVD